MFRSRNCYCVFEVDWNILSNFSTTKNYFEVNIPLAQLISKKIPQLETLKLRAHRKLIELLRHVIHFMSSSEFKSHLAFMSHKTYRLLFYRFWQVVAPIKARYFQDSHWYPCVLTVNLTPANLTRLSVIDDHTIICTNKSIVGVNTCWNYFLELQLLLKGSITYEILCRTFVTWTVGRIR